MVINISGVPKMVSFIAGCSDQPAFSGIVVIYIGGDSNSRIVNFLLAGCQGLKPVFSLGTEAMSLASLSPSCYHSTQNEVDTLWKSNEQMNGCMHACMHE